MRWLMSALMVVAVTTAFAGSDAGPTYILAIRDVKPVAVSVVRAADVVAIPLSIASDQRDPVQRFEDIRGAKRLILDKARENKRLTIKEGPLSLSARPMSKLSLLSVASYSSYEQPSTASLTIMMSLDPQAPDVFAAAGEITRFMNSIKFAEKTQCSLGQVQLAVTDPEQHRAALLQLIAQDVRRTKDQMGIKGTFSIEGLQGPVIVRQMDEARVELFLNYSVTLNGAE